MLRVRDGLYTTVACVLVNCPVNQFDLVTFYELGIDVELFHTDA